MTRNIMSPEERAEYDLLMYDAGYDADGKPRPSHEIAERVIRMLREAVDQTHKPWAELILADILTVGARTQWRAWNREREVVTISGKTYTADKPAVMGIRKKDEETRRTYYQQTFWADMTREELAQIIDGSSKRIASERVTIAAARRLLRLLDQVPEARTPQEAADALDVELSNLLADIEGDDEVAA